MSSEIVQVYDEYQKKLEECRNYRKKYLLIENGKEIIETFNVSLLPKFNSYEDPYVNQFLKYMKLITDLDVVNENIIESHEIWSDIKKTEISVENSIYNTYKYKRLNKLNEYIIFDLKHFVDEVIATISVIKGYTIDKKVYISSIGAYLSKKQKNFDDFDNFTDLFQKLDDLSNSYKYSYANSDFNAIGRDEDCFISLYSKYNDFDNQIIPYVVSIDYIVQEFNKFYKFSFELIDELTKSK